MKRSAKIGIIAAVFGAVAANDAGKILIENDLSRESVIANVEPGQDFIFDGRRGAGRITLSSVVIEQPGFALQHWNAAHVIAFDSAGAESRARAELDILPGGAMILRESGKVDAGRHIRSEVCAMLNVAIAADKHGTRIKDLSAARARHCPQDPVQPQYIA